MHKAEIYEGATTSGRSQRAPADLPREAPSGVRYLRAKRGCGRQVTAPIAPLELEFISGPRMGERITVTSPVCTLGRADGNGVQVCTETHGIGAGGRPGDP